MGAGVPEPSLSCFVGYCAGVRGFGCCRHPEQEQSLFAHCAEIAVLCVFGGVAAAALATGSPVSRVSGASAAVDGGSASTVAWLPGSHRCSSSAAGFRAGPAIL